MRSGTESHLAWNSAALSGHKHTTFAGLQLTALYENMRQRVGLKTSHLIGSLLLQRVPVFGVEHLQGVRLTGFRERAPARRPAAPAHAGTRAGRP